MTDDFRQAALDYHEFPVPGKIGVALTKPSATQHDLSLTYTPGVAEPVKEIARDKEAVYRYTGKGNLVGIITNGTAVLGLGDVGALASKPVMEGKAVLFKAGADINAYDIEVDCDNADAFIDIVTAIAPTFGGINLEDIKAPECFIIERVLRERLSIPVFHDDQHGTAIVIAAGLLNALELQNKQLATAKIVCAGAGAAGIATMRLLVRLGACKQNILIVDRGGVVHIERHDLNDYKREFAATTTAKRTLADALHDADIFIGLSGPGIMTVAMLQTMAAKPIIFALSNPVPEIMPDLVHRARPDAIVATGRSDFPNQINNAVCFPFIFRGALDVQASCINEAMQLAAVHAIRALAHEPVPAAVRAAYPLQQEGWVYGPHYLLPKPIDNRLRTMVVPAVAQAAIDSGVARLVAIS